MKDYSPKNGNNQEEHKETLLNGLENINSLEELAKHGARIILSLALKNEIDEYKEKTESLRDVNQFLRGQISQSGDVSNERRRGIADIL